MRFSEISGSFYIIWKFRVECFAKDPKTIDNEFLMASESEQRENIFQSLIESETNETKLIIFVKNYSKLDMYEAERDLLQNNPESILANPITAFLLIKHLSTELGLFKIVQNEIFSNFDRNIDFITRKESYPTVDDLKGAGLGMIRLQTTYNLDTNDLSNGIINGKAYVPPLTADDCLSMGRAMQLNKGTEMALGWYKIALKRVNITGFNPGFEVQEIPVLLEVAPLFFAAGRINEALSCTMKILELDPDNKEAKELQNMYSNVYDNYMQRPDDEPEAFVDGHYNAAGEFELYSRVCAGEITQNVSMTSKLYCHYKTTIPFTWIAPFKVEYASFAPHIVIFHEVMTDDNIEWFREKSYSRVR